MNAYVGKHILISLVVVLTAATVNAQHSKVSFETLPDALLAGMKPYQFGNILCTSKGTVLIATSSGLAQVDKMQLELPGQPGVLTGSDGKKMFLGKNPNIFRDLYESGTGIKLICEGPDRMIYVVSDNNNFGCINYNLGSAIGMPPFNFYDPGELQKTISKIWIDAQGTLFIGDYSDTVYYIEKATKIFAATGNKNVKPGFLPGLDKDSNFIITQGALPVKKIVLGKHIWATSFAEDKEDRGVVYIGTNKGLYGYNIQTKEIFHFFDQGKDSSLTITDINIDKYATLIWFSTLEKGMASYNKFTKLVRFFPYPKTAKTGNEQFPVNTFSPISGKQFLVAVADSLPAVFNTETGKYFFITDSLFATSPNRTTDIKVDSFGNLFATKGGRLFWSKSWLQNTAQSFKTDSALYGPFITDIVIGEQRLQSRYDFAGRVEGMKQIDLEYDNNSVQIFYSCRGIPSDSLVFAWKLDNFNNDWTVRPYSFFGEEMNMISFGGLKPGRYVFHLKAKSANRDWLRKQVDLVINIEPPFWLEWWFWVVILAVLALLVYGIVWLRVSMVRRQERLKSAHEKDMLELEAKALRAQMNPHFIFNCMNSIKALIQKKEEDKAVNYLTTFSKLIRTIFQNSDKREITLFDEMETCRLYMQLESMRFDNKFSYRFDIDENIDLKSLLVPALIIQPFIENAIWHGIMPKEEAGFVHVKVQKEGESISCVVDDNGIGREMSKQNKFKGEPSTHQSRGVHLTQSRLDLDNALNRRNASVAIIDKTDDEGKPAGTTVILTFKEY